MSHCLAINSLTHFKTPQASRKRKGDSFNAVSTPTELSTKDSPRDPPTVPQTTGGVRQSSRQRKTKNTRNNDFVYDVPSSGRDDFYDHHCKQCESELVDNSKGTC